MRFLSPLALIEALCKDVEVCHQDIQYIVNRFNEEGLSFLTKTLPSFSKGLLMSLESGAESYRPSGFALVRNGKLPFFLFKYTSVIFDKPGTCEAAYALKSIRQICEFFYKCEAPFSDASIEEYTRNFLFNEEVVSNFNNRQLNLSVHAHTASILSALLRGYNPEVASCLRKDGPGSTFERETNRGVPKRRNNYPTFQVPPDLNCFSESSFDQYTHHSSIQFPKSHIGLRSLLFDRGLCSEITFVPKDSRGPRVIAIEPSINQYVQQGIMKHIVPLIEGNSNFRINFASSEVNRNLALAGSFGRQRIFTFDLKDASDMIPTSLLALFPKRFVDDVLQCRSAYTLIGGKRHLLSKVASMGSALCFPILAMVTYCAAVVYLCEQDSAVNWEERVFVYGDDLIVFFPEDFEGFSKDDFSSFLTREFCLKLNTSKSFTSLKHPFRESCGVDAYNGVDVKPILVRKMYSPSEGTSDNTALDKALVSSLETANLLAKNGYTLASTYLFDWVEFHLGVLPVGDSNCPYLCKVANTPYYPEESFLAGVRYRKSTNTYRVQFRTYYVKSLKKTLKNENFFEWFSSEHLSIGSPQRREIGSFSSREIVLERRWSTPYNGSPKSKWLPN